MSVAGQFALVSLNGEGRARQGCLLGGARLACGKLRINLPEPETALRVRSVSGRTIRLGQRLGPGLAGTGSYLLACGPPRRYGNHRAPYPRTGFEIESTTPAIISLPIAIWALKGFPDYREK
jgi:hypothetical protein